MKRLITSMLIVLLISVAFIGSFYKGYYSYAEDINYMSDAELEAAYQAYLQSKGGGLLGNAGARLAYTNGKMLNFLASESNTTPFKNLNQVKGLLSWEKAELESGNTSVLQLTMRHPEVFSLYTQWLLQNHYFGNGVNDTDGMFDDNIDNTLYDGKYYDGSFIYTVSSFVTSVDYPSNKIITRGNYYLYDSTALRNMSIGQVGQTVTYNINGNNYNLSDLNDMGTYTLLNGYAVYGYNSGWYNNINGYGCLIFRSSDNTLWLGVYNKLYFVYQHTNKWRESCYGIRQINGVTPENVEINFYTNTNNNVLVYPTIDADGTLYIQPKVKVGVDYEPYTINEGDTITNVVNNYYNDSGTKDKTITVPSNTPPSSGGGSGGSGGSGGTPPNWSNPYPNLSPDGNGGFNFNFSLPDLNIDWNINGLSEKFPFSIPFDLIRFITVLNAEPETPHFEGTVNLIVYQWDIDADLSQFDNLASIVRNVEFIGFCITLILITRKMIKG